jgi:hypothetical protein
MAFMRMRSPSSAPPLLRRDGSIDHRDAQALSSWSSRRRRISSSVRLILPAPPVPVMPSTGTLAAAAGAAGGHQCRVGLAVLQRGDQLRQRAPGSLAVALDGIQRVGA